MSKKCRFFIYSLGVGITLLVFYLLVLFVCHFGVFTVHFKLLGEDKIVLSLKEEYKEYGFEVYYRFKNYQEEVQISGSVDTSKVGKYTITYAIPSLDVYKRRIVEVKDTQKPNIQLHGETSVHTFVNQPYKEEGASAYDSYDQDVSDSIKIVSDVDIQKEGIYYVTYSAQDKSGNKASIQRKVIVNKDPTQVVLSYHYDLYNNESMQWWFKKSEQHARVEGALNATYLEKFDAYYQGEDEKVIYLSFDEGGSEKTYIKEIASLLNRYEIRGTFFLTKNYILKEADFIKDLVAHGHIVGNHTHNHLNMAELANESDIEKFCVEVTSVEKAYMQVTGQKMCKVFRFPKGEASERTMKMVQDLGYKTYFWSHAYYDYGETLSYEKAYTNMIDYYHNGAIYLMHPNNKGNYDALEAFIKEMLEQGYTFKTVDQIK